MNSETTANNSDAPPRNGWILFDASCGFCSWWIPMWSSVLLAHGYQTAPLQADWVQTKLGLSETELLSEIRLLRSDGVPLTGANVYRDVMRNIWWLWPGYALSLLPGLRQLFDWGYRVVNRNRYRISKSCGLKPPIS